MHPLGPSVVLYILLNSDLSKINLFSAILSKGQVQLIPKLEICALGEDDRFNTQSTELAVRQSLLFS